MSLQYQLSIHLNDFVFLVGRFLESFQSQNFEQVCGKLLTALLEKNELMQKSVRELIRHQKFQNLIQNVEQEIKQIDGRIIDFATKLGQLEQALYTAVYERNSQSSDNLGAPEQQSFTVHQVLLLAERLALMSAAPSDYVERNGMSLCRPPAPLEDLMSASRLHASLDDLVEMRAQLDEGGEEDQGKITMLQGTALPSTSQEDQLDIPSEWEDEDFDDIEKVAALWSKQRNQTNK